MGLKPRLVIPRLLPCIKTRRSWLTLSYLRTALTWRPYIPSAFESIHGTEE